MKNEYDVVVLGGGVAGVSAALASAEMGAKTCLIEKEGFLGGMATGAYVIALCGFYDGHLGKNKVIRGNFERIVNKAIKMGFAEGTKWNRRCKPKDAREVTIDPEGFKYVLDRIMIENKVDLYFHTLLNHITMSNLDKNSISFLWGQSKEGRHMVESKIFIDCTGDADTAVWLGSTHLLSDSGVSMGVRFGGLDLKKIRAYEKKHGSPIIEFPSRSNDKLEIGDQIRSDSLHGFCWMDIKDEHNAYNDAMTLMGGDQLTIEDITYAETRGRQIAQEGLKQLRKYSGFEKAYILSTGAIIGSRKPRHVITQYYLTDEDENQNPYDSIAIAGNVMKDYGAMKIPFRCLLPKKINNLLYAGRTFTPLTHSAKDRKNANFIAYEIPRLIGCCMATGEAAGVAAALCALNDITTDKLDYKRVQGNLKRRGAMY